MEGKTLRVMKAGIISVLCVSLMMLSLPGFTGAEFGQAHDLVYRFDAYRMVGGELAFQGDYTVSQHDGMSRETHRYFNTLGELVYEAEAVFDSVKRRPVSLRALEFLAQRINEVELEGETFNIRVRAMQGGALLESRQQAWEPDLVFWPNLLPWLKAQLPTTPSPTKHSVRLYDLEENSVFSLVLERMDVHPEDSKKPAPEVVSEIPGAPVRWRVRVDMFLLGALLPKAYLTFPNGNPEQGFEYQGRTVLRNSAGDHEYLRIVYTAQAPVGAGTVQ